MRPVSWNCPWANTKCSCSVNLFPHTSDLEGLRERGINELQVLIAGALGRSAAARDTSNRVNAVLAYFPKRSAEQSRLPSRGLPRCAHCRACLPKV